MQGLDSAFAAAQNPDRIWRTEFRAKVGSKFGYPLVPLGLEALRNRPGDPKIPEERN